VGGSHAAERLVNGSNFYLGLTNALVSLFPSAAKSLGIIKSRGIDCRHAN